jgi:hypothetical protein
MMSYNSGAIIRTRDFKHWAAMVKYSHEAKSRVKVADEEDTTGE